MLPTRGKYSRRQFVLGASGLTAATMLPCSTELFANSDNKHNRFTPLPELSGNEFNLVVGQQSVNFTGRTRSAVCVNDSLPGPLLRMREGEDITINVANALDEDTSVHWHGIILPSGMDGVPGLSFAGIKPGESFSYRFKLQQSGTYWYHSHSGYQEPLGLYGPLIIEPLDKPTHSVDRDYVVMLSDWSDENPATIYTKLKKLSHYYNTHQRTFGDWWRDVRENGLRATANERAMWNRMRMSDSDLADVTGYTYTYLMNGCTPADGWWGQFSPGEKVRLRFINGSSMSIFDVRIPGLKMTVVAADGQDVQPIEVDEFRIGTAETYDVIVQPDTGAYTLFAQSLDRSGYARGTLTSDVNLGAEIPAMDYVPTLSHRDMGMAHDEHETAHDMNAHAEHSASTPKNSEQVDHSTHTMDHSEHTMPQTSDTSSSNNETMSQHQQDHNLPSEHNHNASTTTPSLGLAGFGSNNDIAHATSEFGPQVDMRAEAPLNGLLDPGVGLRDHAQRYNRRVLNYGDLRSVHPTRDTRQPTREIQLHLTGNMERYMWSMNGIKFAHAEPLQLQFGERVRIVLVNDTMMTHPIHLHGIWSELETGAPEFIPRKHTVLVQPGAKISYLITADAEGRWAYHCHLVYHMAGMFREVNVTHAMMDHMDHMEQMDHMKHQQMQHDQPQDQVDHGGQHEQG